MQHRIRYRRFDQQTAVRKETDRQSVTWRAVVLAPVSPSARIDTQVVKCVPTSWNCTTKQCFRTLNMTARHRWSNLVVFSAITFNLLLHAIDVFTGDQSGSICPRLHSNADLHREGKPLQNGHLTSSCMQQPQIVRHLHARTHVINNDAMHIHTRAWTHISYIHWVDARTHRLHPLTRTHARRL